MIPDFNDVCTYGANHWSMGTSSNVTCMPLIVEVTYWSDRSYFSCFVMYFSPSQENVMAKLMRLSAISLSDLGFGRGQPSILSYVTVYCPSGIALYEAGFFPVSSKSFGPMRVKPIPGG